MRWIDKLERRWGRYGIPNLMNIILVGQLIAWVIVMVINQNFYYAITLNRTALPADWIRFGPMLARAATQLPYMIASAT